MNSALWLRSMRPLGCTTSSRVSGFSENGIRFLTSRAARALLGLPVKASSETSPLTLKELRHAYFSAAKKCHPDVKQEEDDADEFLQITRAYELLQAEITQNEDDLLVMGTICSDEEEEFRRACQSVLGIDAEIVEECKQNPMFRQWLSGRTDAAYHWKTFFLQHGGLAPKLRQNFGRMLTAGSTPPPSHSTRRKRK